MITHLRVFLATSLVTSAMLLAACQLQPLSPTMELSGPAPAQVADETPAPPAEQPAEMTSENPTAMPTEEAAAEEAEPTVPPIEEPAKQLPAPTATTKEEIKTQASVMPIATILVNRLNVRAGPGVNYDILAVVGQGDELEIRGQSDSCGWLLIQTPAGESGWISGAEQYVSHTAACSEIPVAAAPPTPVPPTPEPEPEPIAPQEAAEPAAAPEAESTGGEGEDPFPADQGCYLMENHIGAELFVTVTAQDWEWVDHFTVDRMGEHLFCLSPGRYTFTIDAPPPWADLNTELKVSAGDRLLWPIWGQQ